MNTLVITTVTAMLAFTAGNVSAPAVNDLATLNPIGAFSISAGGVEVEFGADGPSTRATTASALALTLTLKSGTPITVTF